MITHYSRIDGIHSQFVEAENHQETKAATNSLSKLMEKFHETKTLLSKVSPDLWVSRVVIIWLYVHVQALLFGMCMK